MSNSCIFDSRQGDIISRTRTVGRVRVGSSGTRQHEYSRTTKRTDAELYLRYHVVRSSMGDLAWFPLFRFRSTVCATSWRYSGVSLNHPRETVLGALVFWSLRLCVQFAEIARVRSLFQELEASTAAILQQARQLKVFSPLGLPTHPLARREIS